MCDSYKKITKKIEDWTIDFRACRSVGARRIQTKLFRLHECQLSLASIHKVLVKHVVKPIKKLKRKNKYKRYSSLIPYEIFYVKSW